VNTVRKILRSQRFDSKLKKDFSCQKERRKSRRVARQKAFCLCLGGVEQFDRSLVGSVVDPDPHESAVIPPLIPSTILKEL
jgi:hypothetical protein